MVCVGTVGKYLFTIFRTLDYTCEGLFTNKTQKFVNSTKTGHP